MQGQIALYIRILLYWIAGQISAKGLAVWDETAGTLTFDMNSLALFLAGLIVAAVTFVWSRWVSRKGGAT